MLNYSNHYNAQDDFLCTESTRYPMVAGRGSRFGQRHVAGQITKISWKEIKMDGITKNYVRLSSKAGSSTLHLISTLTPPLLLVLW